MTSWLCQTMKQFLVSSRTSRSTRACKILIKVNKSRVMKGASVSQVSLSCPKRHHRIEVIPKVSSASCLRTSQTTLWIDHRHGQGRYALDLLRIQACLLMITTAMKLKNKTSMQRERSRPKLSRTKGTVQLSTLSSRFSIQLTAKFRELQLINDTYLLDF